LSQDVFFLYGGGGGAHSMFLHTVTVTCSLRMYPDNYSAFLSRLGRRALGAPGRQCHRDNGRGSNATSGPAAVGAASQAVPVSAALGASAAAVLVVGHW